MRCVLLLGIFHLLPASKYVYCEEFQYTEKGSGGSLAVAVGGYPSGSNEIITLCGGGCCSPISQHSVILIVINRSPNLFSQLSVW